MQIVNVTEGNSSEGKWVQVIVTAAIKTVTQQITPTHPKWPRLKAAGDRIKLELKMSQSFNLITVDTHPREMQFTFTSV